MSDVTVKIGAEELTLPLIVYFDQLERAWPAIKVLSTELDPVARTSAQCAFMSGLLLSTRPDLTTGEIKKRLLVNRVTGTDQRPALADAVDKLIIASGLIQPGEATPPTDGEPAAAATT